MREVNPFGVFVPKGASYLLLGTFPGRLNEKYNWFFSSQRNQFWPILSKIYKRELRTREEKQKLFRDLRLAVTDTILSCQRRDNNNSDTNLINIERNTKEIERILKKNKIKKIYFTSLMARRLFLNNFKNTEAELITLPSPSPRYARMKLTEKIERYKELMPELPNLE